MKIPPIKKKDESSEPSPSNVPMPTKIVQIAKMLRNQTTRPKELKKRTGTVLSPKKPELGSINTIEQVAKLLRSHASKVKKKSK